MSLARISLTLSRHFSLSFIASGRSSGLHPVSSHSCCIYVPSGRPAFAWPYAGVHRSTSLMSSSLLKSDLTNKMKRSFFQAAVVSILLYGCTTWTLTKRLKKKLDGNYTRMLRAILNKSWRQHSTRHQLYGHMPSITKIIQVRQTRHIYIYIYIVIHGPTVSFYQNSSVWLDMQDARSRDRNPSNFT